MVVPAPAFSLPQHNAGGTSRKPAFSRENNHSNVVFHEAFTQYRRYKVGSQMFHSSLQWFQPKETDISHHSFSSILWSGR